MNASILDTIKKLLGLSEDYIAFDTDIIVHINASLWRLRQLGVGKDNFIISNRKQLWSDYLGDDMTKMAIVQRYIYIDVKLAFDPPTNNASLYNAFNQEKEKLESLIVYECDPHYE